MYVTYSKEPTLTLIFRSGGSLLSAVNSLGLMLCTSFSHFTKLASWRNNKIKQLLKSVSPTVVIITGQITEFHP